MSSYLVFKFRTVINSRTEWQPVLCYSRSTDVYERFTNEISIPYNKEDGEADHIEVTIENVDSILEDVNKDIEKSSSVLHALEKVIPNTDLNGYVSMVLEQKNYLKELYELKGRIITIKDILIEVDEYGTCDFTGLYCTLE